MFFQARISGSDGKGTMNMTGLAAPRKFEIMIRLDLNGVAEGTEGSEGQPEMMG